MYTCVYLILIAKPELFLDEQQLADVVGAKFRKPGNGGEQLFSKFQLLGPTCPNTSTRNAELVVQPIVYVCAWHAPLWQQPRQAQCFNKGVRVHLPSAGKKNEDNSKYCSRV